MTALTPDALELARQAADEAPELSAAQAARVVAVLCESSR